MAEGFEKTAFQEAMHESVVGKAVRGAVAEAQQTNKEYWDIRKSIEDRGTVKGFYRHYVDSLDKVVDRMYGGEQLGTLGKLAAANRKLGIRLEGFVKATGLAVGDFVLNTLTWLPRKLSPIGPPRNMLHKMALVKLDIKMAGLGIGATAFRGALEASQGVRTATNVAIHAPEIAIRMAKKKVERVVNWIKKPYAEQKPSMPKARP